MAISTLVIEDNSTNLELMEYLLTAFGHSVLKAESGSAGIEIAVGKTPDLIICDIQLPGMDGYEVVSKLKSHPGLENIPVIAVTAMAMVGDRDKVMRSGFDGYIPKPINPETFLKEIEAFLPVGHAGRDSQAAERFEYSGGNPGYSANVEGGRGSILLINHSATNLDLARNLLEPSGYELILAQSFNEALDRATETQPKMVLCDLHDFGQGRTEPWHDLLTQPKLRSVRFIFLSSRAEKESDRTARMAHPKASFIQRPVEPKYLLEMIETSS